MADPETLDMQGIESHTLAYLRSHGRKLDLILETLGRQGDRLARLERDVGEGRRDNWKSKATSRCLKTKS